MNKKRRKNGLIVMVKGIFTFLDLFVRVCFKGKEKKKKKFIEK